MGTVALALGIISLSLAVGGGIAGVSWLGPVCAIFGIILGIIASKKPEHKGAAKTGVVLSVIALIWGTIVTIACVSYLASVSTGIDFSSYF